MKKNIVHAALAGLFLLMACCTAGAQKLPEIKKEIEEHNALYLALFSKHDLAIVDLYTDDGYLLSPNAPVVKGRAALLQDFSNAYQDGTIKGVKFDTETIYGNGPLFVTEEGTWQVLGTDGRMLDSGKYLKLWKKTRQGWKIFRDIFNSTQKGH
ncbi:YybH family protein [Hymenobacter negativus]|uniref:DUF4440 domain-containing protein n=1 Tax=Hymenobacter negativus TaxID=2795026 RepID=A0ABS3QM74_9BACT|nr:DUF4440 domain-containing protein [Hymenobacter negativus]MBO2012217.1 DUF4440 domain-containing protein [Hymenobacter negativus]